MWKILLAISVIHVFCCIIPIRCLEKRAQPWFIYKDAIYYIETETSYTSSEARYICIDRNMIFTIKLYDNEDILKYITSVYGHHASFWTYDNEKRSYEMALNEFTTAITDSCYRLDTLDSQYYEENCSKKLSFICKRNFKGASTYFVNGTHRDTRNPDDVKTYCNPHSHEYDDVLELCVIKYFTISPNTSSAI